MPRPRLAHGTASPRSTTAVAGLPGSAADQGVWGWSIGLGMRPHGATPHIVRLLRQTWSGLPDGIEEQHGLAIRVRTSSQETVHMWGQDVPSMVCIQEVVTIGAGAPDLDIRGMASGALGQLLDGQSLWMCGKLIEKAGLYPCRDDVHGLEPIPPLLQPLGLLMQAKGLGISHGLPPCPECGFAPVGPRYVLLRPIIARYRHMRREQSGQHQR